MSLDILSNLGRVIQQISKEKGIDQKTCGQLHISGSSCCCEKKVWNL